MKKKEDRLKVFEVDYKWVYSKNMYHRGKFDNVKVHENTIEAYRAAMEEKCPIELDVRLTGDGEVVCLHDRSLKRLFNRERDISDISYKRLNKLRDDLNVPLLKDVLKEIDGKVELMIEIKSSTYSQNKALVKKVYEILKDYNGKYVVVSFNPNILRRYKRLDKGVFTGRIGSKESNGFIEKLVINNFLWVGYSKPDFISFDVYNYDEEKLTKLKEKGYKIIGWPLKSKEEKKTLSKIFDNYIVEGFSIKEK